MLCPNCGQQMNVRNVDNEIVLHCSTCGSSFFDKNGINKITSSSARLLTEEAQGQYVLGNQKLCPKDKSILLEKIDATLPKNTILLECPSCEGIFAYPDDLLKYKGVKAAQPLASGAFKLLPAPKSLFMLASFAVLSLAVLLNAGNFSSNTRASSIYGAIHMSKSGRYFSVQFTTQDPTTSTIIFYDGNGKDKHETHRFVIASKPVKVHQALSITDFDSVKDKFYSIDLSGVETPLTEVKLEKQ